MSEMKRFIIYDLDGTLVDTLEDIAQAANHMLRLLQKPPLDPDTVRRSVGMGLKDLVKGCLQTDDPKLIDEGTRVWWDYYGQHLVDHSRLYPGARDVLEHFKTRQQAVLTNKPNPFSRQLLETLGVGDYFREIIGPDEPHPKKPDPAVVRAMMERAGVTVEETLIIGDSPVDIQTGRNAGVLTVVLSHGLADEAELRAARPDLLVKDFPELLTLAKRRRW